MKNKEKDGDGSPQTEEETISLTEKKGIDQEVEALQQAKDEAMTETTSAREPPMRESRNPLKRSNPTAAGTTGLVGSMRGDMDLQNLAAFMSDTSKLDAVTQSQLFPHMDAIFKIMGYVDSGLANVSLAVIEPASHGPGPLRAVSSSEAGPINLIAIAPKMFSFVNVGKIADRHIAPSPSPMDFTDAKDPLYDFFAESLVVVPSYDQMLTYYKCVDSVAARGVRSTEIMPISAYEGFAGNQLTYSKTEYYGQELLEIALAEYASILEYALTTQAIFCVNGLPGTRAINNLQSTMLQGMDLPVDGTMSSLDDYIPSIPFKAAYFPSGYARAAVMDQFGPGGIPLHVPRRTVPTKAPFKYGHGSFMQMIGHSTDWITSNWMCGYAARVFTNRMEVETIQRLIMQLAPQDIMYTIDPRQMSLTINPSITGKRTIEAFTVLATNTRHAIMERELAMLSLPSIMEVQPADRTMTLRNAIADTAKNGTYGVQASDPSAFLNAKLSEPVRQDDLFHALICEQFEIYEPFVLRDQTDVRPWHGESFITWFNSMLNYRLFRIAPSSLGNIYAAGVWLFTLERRRGITPFSQEEFEVPKVGTFMGTERCFPNRLLGGAADADEVVMMYDKLFDLPAPVDQVQNYDWEYMRENFDIRQNPFDSEPTNPLQPIYYQTSSGFTRSRWQHDLDVFLTQLLQFLNAIPKEAQVKNSTSSIYMINALNVLAANTTYTTDAAAVVLGQYRRFQANSIHQYRHKLTCRNNRRHWIRQFQPGAYMCTYETLLPFGKHFQQVSPIGSPWRPIREVNSRTSTRVIPDITNARNFNAIGFLWNVCAAEEYTLTSDPMALLNRTIQETWDGQRLAVAFNSMERIMQTGGTGPLKYALWAARVTTRTRTSQVIFKAISQAVGLNDIGPVMDGTFAPMGLAADLSVKFSTIKFNRANFTDPATPVAERPVQLYEPYDSTLLAEVELATKIVRPIAHVTNYVAFHRRRTLNIDFREVMTGRRLLVIAAESVTAEIEAREIRTATSSYFLDVVERRFWLNTSWPGKIALTPEGAEIDYMDVNTYPRAKVDLDSLMRNKDTVAYYIDFTVLRTMSRRLRELLLANVDYGMTLIVGGHFQYDTVFYSADTRASRDTVREWFMEPTMMTRVQNFVRIPQNHPIFEYNEWYYCLLTPEVDGFVWMMPSEVATDVEIPREPDFQYFRPKEFEFNPYMENPQVALQRNFIDGFQNAPFSLYSSIPFLRTSAKDPDSKNVFGVTVNKPAISIQGL